jgi:hypothetical protein
MNIFVLYTFLSFISLNTSTLFQYKKCSDCKFFIGNDYTCQKFGVVNLVTGKYEYADTNIVRYDESKCGKDASQFEKNNFKHITIPYYFVLRWWAVILITIIWTL